MLSSGVVRGRCPMCPTCPTAGLPVDVVCAPYGQAPSTTKPTSLSHVAPSVTEAGAWVAEWSSGSPATNLNRPLRERIFVCVLMGTGLFASMSSHR